ncbi:MAG: MliC family protein [Bauldia sp.]
MWRVLWASLALAVWASAAPWAAHAETRLFTVRTTLPGVTVVEATRNGADLPVAGTNAGATFFRIDNPQGAVPCASRIRFVASNGQTIDRQVDLCANNWDLTLAVSGGGAATPTPPVVSNPPPAQVNLPASTRQAVAIATDDPGITIANVFLRGEEVPIVARQDPYVQINVLGGPSGFDCSRDLGLALSDGRRIARPVDICAANYLVVIPLVGGVVPPVPPANFRPRAVIQPLPRATAPLPRAQLPAPPPVAAAPEYVTNMQWLFSATGTNASFAYAIPNTEASEFTAVCALRSRQITLTLTRTADELGPGGTVPVTFTAGAFARTYAATGSAVSELDGVSHPVLRLNVADPLWPAMIKEKALQIRIGSSPAYALSLSGSAVQAKQFLAACSPSPPPPGLTDLPPPVPGPPIAGPVASASSFLCDDGSTINVAFQQDTAVVYEPGAPPVVLFSAPSQSGTRWIAGLSQLVGLGEQVFWTRQGGNSRACQRG